MRVLALASLALVALAVPVAACAETRRAVGEECLKNDDCLSGVCVARACDHPASSLDRPLPPTPPTATATQDASLDAIADVRGDGPSGG
jgi:hypothetical protein